MGMAIEVRRLIAIYALIASFLLFVIPYIDLWMIAFILLMLATPYPWEEFEKIRDSWTPNGTQQGPEE